MKANTNDTVKEWLGAYLDGELNASRRAWVEEHLATCEACQVELQALRQLSAALQADALPAASSEDFTARLLRALPPRSAIHGRWSQQAAGALRWAPLGLFGLWVLFEVVLAATGMLLFGLSFLQIELPTRAGLLGGWLNGALTAAGADQAAALVWPGVVLLALELAGTALVAVLFSAWLAGFYSFRRARGVVEA